MGAWLSPAHVAAIAVFASILAKMLTQKIVDIDLWWHLRTGEYILATKSIPREDIYSFTAAGKKWVVQEWGSEVLLQWIREAFGLWGIVVWRTAMILAIYALVARLLVRRMGTGIGTWILLALVAYAGSMNWTERPNLFSFLLFVVTLFLIERRDKGLWWFVPLCALWANLHGMVILGIGLVGLVAAAEGLKIAFHWEDADPLWAKRLGLVTAAAAAAALVNPAGPGLYVHAATLVRTVAPVITEWFSPDFHEPGALIFLILLLVMIAALALHPERPDPTDVALGLAFTTLALTAVRNLAVSAIAIGIVTARYIPGAIAAARPRPPGRADVGERASLALGALGLILALGVLTAITVAGLPSSDAPEDMLHPSFPIAAIDELDRPGVRVLAIDIWAGLVIDRAWPNALLAYDSRVDVYGRRAALRYARTVGAFPEWSSNLDRTCTTHVLTRRRDPIAQVLTLSDDWRVEREDRRSVTFVRNSVAPGCDRHPIP